MALLRLLGCELILAYNLVWAGTILVIALSVRLWVRELGASESAASVAGCAVALTTSTLFEISRLQMLSFQWIPLALFSLHRFFRTGRTRWSVAIAVCLVLQGLSGQYYLISFPLFLLPIVVGYAYLFPERRTLGSVFRLTIPSTLGALLLLLIGLQYLEIFQRYGFERPLVSSGADLLSYVVPPTTNLFYGWLWSSSMPAITGTKTFLGYGAIALAIVGLISLWRHQSNDPATRRYRWLSLWLAIWGGLLHTPRCRRRGQCWRSKTGTRDLLRLSRLYSRIQVHAGAGPVVRLLALRHFHSHWSGGREVSETRLESHCAPKRCRHRISGGVAARARAHASLSQADSNRGGGPCGVPMATHYSRRLRHR